MLKTFVQMTGLLLLKNPLLTTKYEVLYPWRLNDLQKDNLIYITSFHAAHYQPQYQDSMVKLWYVIFYILQWTNEMCTKLFTSNTCYITIIMYDSLLQNNIIPENIIQYL